MGSYFTKTIEWNSQGILILDLTIARWSENSLETGLISKNKFKDDKNRIWSINLKKNRDDTYHIGVKLEKGRPISAELRFIGKTNTFSTSNTHIEEKKYTYGSTMSRSSLARYVHDDTFYMMCMMKITDSQPKFQDTVLDDTWIPSESLKVDLERLYLDIDETADASLLLANENTVRLHSLIGKMRSPVLASAFFGSLSKIPLTYSLPNVSLEVGEELICWMYRDDQKIIKIKHAEDLMILAHELDIEGLFLICEQKLLETICVSNVSELLMLSVKYDAAQLRESCEEFCSNNYVAVEKTSGWSKLKKIPECGDIISTITMFVLQDKSESGKRKRPNPGCVENIKDSVKKMRVREIRQAQEIWNKMQSANQRVRLTYSKPVLQESLLSTLSYS